MRVSMFDLDSKEEIKEEQKERQFDDITKSDKGFVTNSVDKNNKYYSEIRSIFRAFKRYYSQNIYVDPENYTNKLR